MGISPTLSSNVRAYHQISGHLYNAIKCIYSKTLSCIKLNNILTEWFDVTSGVRQGDTLSPTLFNLYINDLATGIKDLNKGIAFGNTQVSILLYADDIVLMAADEQSLQDQLNYLYEWCNKGRLSINNSKTNVVHFRPKCVNRTPFEFKNGNVIIETTDHYKHLGLMLDEFVTFESCATVLSQSGNRALGALRNKIRNFKDCRYQTFTKLYHTCVAPILDYGSGVWGYNRFSKTETIQNRALRYFLGVHRFAPNHAIQGDMGWPLCATRRKLEMCRLWNRIVSLPINRLPRIIFDEEYNVTNPRYENWVSEMYNIFLETEFIDVFESKTQCDLWEISHKLKFIETECWEQQRYNKPKLRYYNMVKSCYEPEEYLLVDLPKRRRSFLAQLRAGVLPLHVEVGRFRNTEFIDRKCLVCNDGNIEDEFHFVCICNAYIHWRTELFDTACEHDDSILNQDPLDQFINIMMNYQKPLSLYIQNAMQIRQRLLYV